MSAERFSLFHCLTKDGWLPSTEEEERPEGWVRVCEMEVYEGSGFGRESRNWKRCTTNPDFTNEEADLLEIKYPRPSLKLKALFPEALRLDQK